MIFIYEYIWKSGIIIRFSNATSVEYYSPITRIKHREIF